MSKLLIELITKLVTANGLENNKSAFWRNIAVIFIIVCAIGLLQYGEVMLNVRKIKTTHDIERPIELLEFKLESCKALLRNTVDDLQFCRAIKPKPFIEQLTKK